MSPMARNHQPDAGERIKKEYALLSVFSQDVADAHIQGISISMISLCGPALL